MPVHAGQKPVLPVCGASRRVARAWFWQAWFWQAWFWHTNAASARSFCLHEESAMAIRYFALIYGIVFLLVGLAGFIPAFVTPYPPGHPDLALAGGAGLLFGLFPVNWVHNLIHAAFGVWGIAVWRSVWRSRTYAQSVAIIYAVFAIMGFIPVLNTTFGLAPLHGHDIWLHVLLAVPAAYFGWAVHPVETGEPVVHHDHTP
jgi:hypothetical protein